MPEVVAASLITVTLVAAILEVSRSASSALSTINDEGVLQIQLTQATASFGRDARLAGNVAGACSGFTQNLTSLDDGHATLIFQVPSLDATTGLPLALVDCLIYDFNLAGQPTAPLKRIVRAVAGTRRWNEAPRDVATISAVAFNAGPPPPGMASIRVWKNRTGDHSTFVLDASAALRND